MTWQSVNFVSLPDVWMAYRKTKVDLYYERGHPNALALVDYEEDLAANLHARLNAETLEWMAEPGFVGTWSLMPKGFSPDKPKSSWKPSDPDMAWKAHVAALCESAGSEPGQGGPRASFRLIGVHPIDLHIVSTLWMHKIGHRLDAKLGTEVYGSRLRRKHSDDPDWANDPNPLSLGTFEPYLHKFAAWRDDGLTCMRNALKDGKRVVAITADVKQFYHRTSPDFLLSPVFLGQVLGVELSADEALFTQALVSAIHTWASKTPLHKGDPNVGLPVGLPAARLIANVALAELDRMIKRELTPLYYGRYVDDILLVLEDTRDFGNETEVWDWIIERSGGLLEKRGSDAVFMKVEYLGNSTIEFSGDKQKVFLLEGESGKTLVKSIERHVRERASEWRAMPDIPDAPDSLSADLASACDVDGDQADNLRKADSVSLRRAAFAIRLRDIEAFGHDLPPEHWSVQRKAFFDTICQHVLTLPHLFDFATYLPRLFGLAVACGDYDACTKMLKRLTHSIRLIEEDCAVSIAGVGGADDSFLMPVWRDMLVRALGEVVLAAIPAGRSRKQTRNAFQEFWEGLMGLSHGPAWFFSPYAESRLSSIPSLVGVADYAAAQAWSSRLFVTDLGRIPFRQKCLPQELRNMKRLHSQEPKSVAINGCPMPKAVTDGVASLLEEISKKKTSITELPLPLLFATRPFSIVELFLLAGNPFTQERASINEKIILALRGFSPRNGLPKKLDQTISIPWEAGERGKLRIAVCSWKTNEKSWVASIQNSPDPDRSRHGRINSIVNDILRTPKDRRPQYLVFPELSIPAGWFLRIANKLGQQHISLIAGVEYLHHGKKQVANQVWAALVSDFLGFPSLVLYRQDKKRPAIHEESQLWRIGGRTLRPLTNPHKPRIHHGDLWFALLVCSELTNINFRAKLRGKVDAVFVPEWNPDTHQFATLVESAAADIHSYVIQCNDRQYGDSRIRVPAKKDFRRDIVRIKGGVEDFYVIGEIDVASLREFQSGHRSPTGDDAKFKPVPDGFKISRARKRLPPAKD